MSFCVGVAMTTVLHSVTGIASGQQKVPTTGRAGHRVTKCCTVPTCGVTLGYSKGGDPHTRPQEDTMTYPKPPDRITAMFVTATALLALT